jgi:predicted DCC family thiol-disulfide oxidoreductase YuxK
MPPPAPTKSDSAELPRPEDRPGADVVVYDGDCRFCIRQVQRLARWDTGGRLSFLARQDPRAAVYIPDLDGDEAVSEMRVVDPRGIRYGGASAVRYLTRRLPRLWWAVPLLHIPGSMPLWNWLYRQVAKRRHRWGKSEDCQSGKCKIGPSL